MPWPNPTWQAEGNPQTGNPLLAWLWNRGQLLSSYPWGFPTVLLQKLSRKCKCSSHLLFWAKSDLERERQRRKNSQLQLSHNIKNIMLKPQVLWHVDGFPWFPHAHTCCPRICGSIWWKHSQFLPKLGLDHWLSIPNSSIYTSNTIRYLHFFWWADGFSSPASLSHVSPIPRYLSSDCSLFPRETFS